VTSRGSNPGWQIWQGNDGRRHVVPKDDMRPHRHSIDCWCRPTPDCEDAAILIHNAMDGREAAERAVKH